MNRLSGWLILLLGLAGIGYSAHQAWLLYQTPPEVSLNLPPGQEMDLTATGARLTGLLIKILLLALLAFIGALVTNVGIKLIGVPANRDARTPPSEAE
jgi:hypothetical protein